MDVMLNPVSRRVSRLQAPLAGLKIGVELETLSLDGKTWEDIDGDNALPVGSEEFFAELGAYKIFLASNFDDSLGTGIDTPPLANFRDSRMPDSERASLGKIFPVLRKRMRKRSPGLTYLLGSLEWFESDCFPDWNESAEEGAELLILQVEGWEPHPDRDDTSLVHVTVTVRSGSFTDPVYTTIICVRRKDLEAAIEESFGGSNPETAQGFSWTTLGDLFGLAGVNILLTRTFTLSRERYVEDMITTDENEGWKALNEFAAKGEVPENAGKALARKLHEETGLPIGVEEDGTVPGPELQFPHVGGASIEAVKQALAAFFARHQVIVSTGCSFHIHMSHNPLTRQSERKLAQFLMLKYLSDNANRIPLCVCERILDNRSRKEFFAFKIGLYSRSFFVAWRGETWEFRFFGNVDNYADGVQCIDLAVSAYLWAHHEDVQKEFRHMFDDPHLLVLLEENLKSRCIARLGEEA